MDDTELFSMSDDENAYFESGGETAPKDEAATPPANEPDTEEPDSKTDEPTEEDGEEDGQEEQQRPQGDVKKALAESRAKLRETKARNAKLEQELATQKGRLDILERLARGEPAEKPQAAPLDPETNPIDVIKALQQKTEQFEQTEAQRQQQAEIQRQQNLVLQTYHNQVTEFAQETQDFQEAYQYLLQHRAQELQALGFQGDALRNALQGNEFDIVLKSLNDGVNPAERLYELAKIRGYSKRSPSNTEEERINTMKKAESAGKSLSAVPGNSVKDTPTLDALLKMSDDDFAAATKGRKFEDLVASLSR